MTLITLSPPPGCTGCPGRLVTVITAVIDLTDGAERRTQAVATEISRSDGNLRHRADSFHDYGCHGFGLGDHDDVWALDLGDRGSGALGLRADEVRAVFAPVAQWIEQGFPKAEVASSTLAGGAAKSLGKARAARTSFSALAGDEAVPESTATVARLIAGRAPGPAPISWVVCRDRSG